MSGVLTSVVPSKSSYDDEEGSSPKLVKGVKDVMSRLPTATISVIIFSFTLSSRAASQMREVVHPRICDKISGFKAR